MLRCFCMKRGRSVATLLVSRNKRPERSFVSPALGKRCHGGLACRSVAMCRAAVFVVSDVQCPHPWPCYGHTRIEDTADNFAVGQHVIIVVLPFPGQTSERCAFQREVILFHRDAPVLTLAE